MVWTLPGKEMEMEVNIVSKPIRYECVGEVDISEITDVRWSQGEGGLFRDGVFYMKHSFYCLYGKIDYEIAKEQVDCSGRHSSPDTFRKRWIAIPFSLNKDCRCFE